MHDIFTFVKEVRAAKTFVGIDSKGCDSLVFVLSNHPIFELTTKKISSRIVDKSDSHYLYISLIEEDDTSKEIFKILVDDLLASAKEANNEKELLAILSQRFQYWTDLLKIKNTKLDERKVMGLIGELWFINNVLEKEIGIDQSIKSWTGPDMADQDFITEEKTFEIKTILKSSNSIKISNDNQLHEGINLVIVKVSRSSEVSNSSLTLEKLIFDIRKKINSPDLHSLFNAKLLKMELFPNEQLENYSQFAYEIEDYNYYPANEKFPIIKDSNIPNQIVRYTYEISYDSIEDFVVKEEEIWM